MKNLLECLNKFELVETIISKLKCGLIIKFMSSETTEDEIN